MCWEHIISDINFFRNDFGNLASDCVVRYMKQQIYKNSFKSNCRQKSRKRKISTLQIALDTIWTLTGTWELFAQKHYSKKQLPNLDYFERRAFSVSVTNYYFLWFKSRFYVDYDTIIDFHQYIVLVLCIVIWCAKSFWWWLMRRAVRFRS